jgi:hypothetical protein
MYKLNLKPQMNCIFIPAPGLKCLHLHAMYSCNLRDVSSVILGDLKMLHVYKK